MALIVEDGTVVDGAESYISVEDADTYFTNRGNATWAALSTTDKEQALRKATDYMEGRYVLLWKGDRVDETQALSWPRSNAYVNGFLLSDAAVPDAVARACAELAVRASADDLSPDLTAQVKQETVGPISVTYADGARQDTRYKAIDLMLAPFLKGMGSVPVARA